MILNSWQKISRVLPSRPFGRGTLGDFLSSGSVTQSLTTRSCAGSSASPTLTLGSSGFANGDLVLIMQMRGTGVGQWEVNLVVSGGGTTTLTLKKDLHYTYTDSGSSQAEIIKIPEYKNFTVQSGHTISAGTWTGDIEGFILLAARKTATNGGILSLNGAGFAGGTGRGSIGTANAGEGTAGASVSQTSANGNGGGASNDPTASDGHFAGGGGGGNRTTGGTGGVSAPSTAGVGGAVSSSADGTTITMGGGGGGEAIAPVGDPGNGGRGAGIGIIFADNFINTGILRTNGSDGTASASGGGAGAGAGGFLLLVLRKGQLNQSGGTVTAIGGVGGGVSNQGGNGGEGGIAVHHSGTVTGTTTPAFYDQLDPSLKEVSPAVAALLL